MRRSAAGAGGARALLVLGLSLAACSGGRGASPPTTSGAPATPGPVYVAVGASETTGVGAETPLREAWPRLLFRSAMPVSTTFVNMGIPGATVAQALRLELAPAIDLKPTIVTVWLNVNDVIAGVPADQFERDLGSLVHQLRRNGQTRVLVANVPPVDHLPAYLACRPDPPTTAPPCRAPGGVLPAPDDVNGLVDAYNAATARVATGEGATLVDLHATGLAARAAGIEDALVSADGFHPNAGGYQQVATAFAEALKRSGPIS